MRLAAAALALLSLSSVPAAGASEVDRGQAKLIRRLTSGKWVEYRSQYKPGGYALVDDRACKRPSEYRFRPDGNVYITNRSCRPALTVTMTWTLVASGPSEAVLALDGTPLTLDAGAKFESLVLRSDRVVDSASPAVVAELDHK